MSFKAKDLHFDNSQPAFLQRLRGQLMTGDTARHEQPIARNKRMKKDDNEDDAPTYVMEETNQSLTKEEYEAFVSGKDGEDGAGSQLDKESQATATKPKEKIAEVGGNVKKRKAARIISDDQEGSKEGVEKASEKSNTKAVKKPKKKAKAVKLTFGDEDEG
ncbi:hypothetical protein CFE70_004697 [Pyrenophora teres f. teres 0-1]|uniref:DUF4604 domain-containing protein n=2 Tax=Pyrenophora teres f. teres TaxID=97479 RepID=E3S997_PYRTT|nr:hypothetical protein PTT_19594 [Pyrenophora teres f. teres 0-1]KAE8833647.1 hypothetical protein HRS9139_05466 [Pyrenophora teres f. teres]KAE8849275.1 hypothetical protein HRS9122_03291 [Pyrenophora teres f. teres]KAE8864080.1 hypothetical protein PTNB29_04044 [Pyrenophora teres f. teres]KAE8866876.1 hypothetical protein PTNB73_04970 [Pyrenophora teres f. teres]